MLDDITLRNLGTIIYERYFSKFSKSGSFSVRYTLSREYLPDGIRVRKFSSLGKALAWCITCIKYDWSFGLYDMSTRKIYFSMRFDYSGIEKGEWAFSPVYEFTLFDSSCSNYFLSSDVDDIYKPF